MDGSDDTAMTTHSALMPILFKHWDSPIWALSSASRMWSAQARRVVLAWCRAHGSRLGVDRLGTLANLRDRQAAGDEPVSGRRLPSPYRHRLGLPVCPSGVRFPPLIEWTSRASSDSGNGRLVDRSRAARSPNGTTHHNGTGMRSEVADRTGCDSSRGIRPLRAVEVRGRAREPVSTADTTGRTAADGTLELVELADVLLVPILCTGVRTNE